MGCSGWTIYNLEFDFSINKNLINFLQCGLLYSKVQSFRLVLEYCFIQMTSPKSSSPYDKPNFSVHFRIYFVLKYQTLSKNIVDMPTSSIFDPSKYRIDESLFVQS